MQRQMNDESTKLNLSLHYTPCIMPKRVTSLKGPSSRQSTWATRFLSKKCYSGCEPLATLFSI